MTGELSPLDKARFAAARRATEHVESGMRVGLGTGATSGWMIRCLGERVRDGKLKIRGVPTSVRTAELARQVGIELVDLNDVGRLDLVIDGADEFDRDFNLVKGGGGALLREKIVASASDRMIVIADAAKEVAALGAFPLPVEVVPFGWRTTRALIGEALVGQDAMGRKATLRMDGDAPFVTDEGNRIVDLRLGKISDPRRLSLAINRIPGVVDNGLFIDLCDMIVIGHADGRIETRDMAGDRRDNVFSDL